MTFMREFIVYQRKEVCIYINQCHNPGRKTKKFAIRRDDSHGRADMLATIRWNGTWRQYVVEYDPVTMWTAGCNARIVQFLEYINEQHRKKIRGRR